VGAGELVNDKGRRNTGGGFVTPAIQQSVEFGVSPETLYELYID
jgi:hypothetical protein